jgi:P pilus assembly chaperone PapD
MLQPSPQLRTGLVGLLFLLTAALPAFGQISLAPTTLFIHDRTNVGELFVSNSSSTSQEVSIRFIFGYPSSDSTGSINMVYDDPSRMSESGLDSFIRVFPRRFVLAPGATQAVRVQALPMPTRGDGLFWTRAIISSNQPATDVGLRDTTAIGAVFNYVLEQSIPIFYKKGKPTTGVDFVGLTQTRQDNELSLMLNVRRDGTSPFLGTIYTDLIDAGGNVVRSTSAVSFLYYLEWRKVTFDVVGLTSGNYTVAMRFETQRRDMAPTDLVQAPTQTHSVTITL